ncbi:hypothetical protein KFK09_028598 [Dendrobium nobile]|uniref:RRM domain-containing protein n=1 Tax=Dendrobium nobile TaxID=94219 RepID=A0A8T3A3Q8_DENNO|nr:hypothetical protein KFK09_028598 [Dendrobium nobile]
MAGPGIHHFHQPWAQLPPPPPSISTPPSIAVPARPTNDEVRTIFIAGLPADVKERELHNLLRWLPGFEASQINSKGDLPMGFALFSTAQHAMAAKTAYMAPPVLYAPYGGYPVTQVALPTPAPVPPPTVYAPVQNTKDNPPCNTLFVGNLGESVIEEELRGLFSLQPGYKQMKILRHERNTVCFIEFDDVASATSVHINLQGAVLPSAGRTGIRIQYPFVNFIDTYTHTYIQIIFGEVLGQKIEQWSQQALLRISLTG